ncbi:monovalent cation/H+ antiporter complex subunit F [Alkalilimnicola sp. S0819]|uniref:monovalent cation/H+ antiporter complex subunit F n=1 Tax=Alkalilimnicola sp. S0819 TaxID=2613922 RepID=UPI001261C6CE|nr:monovalent cation/H+ antiporter complex subunit F [Alkalilimnicola sp. S0819]KAB7627482.1 pH regulation protein F [Alkalilimnicola sp. S0819]MPQ15634.1 pH regulation protein F [Alkalilimnicola sp. S0819]
MDTLLLGLAVFLQGNILAGLWRIWRGPTAADRMLAALLFGSTGIAVSLLLGMALRLPAALDVALILALLAVIAALAFVRRAWRPEKAAKPTKE